MTDISPPAHSSQPAAAAPPAALVGRGPGASAPRPVTGSAGLYEAAATPRFVVTGIRWERVVVQLELQHVDTSGVPSACDDTATLAFTLVDKVRVLPLEAVALADAETPGRYVITINITTFADRKQVPDGTWSIVPILDDVPGPAASFPLDRLAELDEASRPFLYNGNRTCYVVSFAISESDADPSLLMRTYQLFRGSKKPRSLNPATLVRRKVINRKNKLRAARSIVRVAERRPRPRPRVLFASEMRSSLEGNLLAVRDRMLQRGLDAYFELDYSFRLPRSTGRTRTAQVLWQLGSADFILVDDYFPMLEGVRLRPGTRVVQLWHAGSGFKSIGFSRFGKYGSPKLQNAHRHYTHVTCGSQHLVPVYAEAFGLEESAVVPTGLPRIDTFLDPVAAAAAVERVHTDHPELRGKRVVLFAPTFRGRGFDDAYYPFDNLDLRRLADELGPDTVFCLRMHHFVKDRPAIPPELAGRVVDLTGYGVTNDLLHATDVLVTDYSSIIYEFSLLHRPMVFYAFDKDVYQATRGFHNSYEETAPGKIVTTFDALVEALRTEDFELWKVDAYVADNFAYTDRHSSDRVIDQLILSDPRLAHLAIPPGIPDPDPDPAPAPGDGGVADTDHHEEAEHD